MYVYFCMECEKYTSYKLFILYIQMYFPQSISTSLRRPKITPEKRK